jgi:hypothetical protein
MASTAHAIAQHAVADVEDLDAVLADTSVEPRARKRLTQVRDRRLAEVPGVPISVAAGMLGLSPQSVRAWINAGVLDAVADTRPVKVSTGRLAKVVSLVERLRRAGKDRDLLNAVIDRLEDERLLAQPRVRRSLDQLRRGQVEALSAEEL